METIELKSGVKLGLAVAPFSSANKLRKALAAELGAVSLDLDLSKLGANVADLDVAKLPPSALNSLKNVICKLLSSDVIEAAFFECAARCTLDGKKITREIFDENEALRVELIPVAQEVIRANVAPFFASLDLRSLIQSAAPSRGQPSG